MRWTHRICLLFALLGVAFLAAWPYLPALQKEWTHLKAAWAQVQAGDFPEPSTAAKGPPAETPVAPAPRNRQVATPHSTTEAENDGQDPDAFLAEARRRARENPESAMLWLQSESTGGKRLRGMLEVVALWAAEDSESALLWLESNAQGIARFETLHSGIELWAERSPERAAEWVDGMANDGSKAAAAESLAATWAQADPQLAAEWVRGLAPGPIRRQAAAAMTETWARQDPQAASVWALTEAEFNGNTELLQIAVESYTEQDPTAAEAFLREMAAATDATAVLASHIKARASLDPSAAAAWLESIPASDPIDSPENARHLMQVWAESDSIAASEWLSRQPAGPQRDAAIEGFSETIQSFEPAAAATWASAIADPRRRVSRLREHITEWSRNDPQAAAEWIQTAELAPALRTELADQVGLD
ncbi:MAG: hypothetical protein GVY36_10950 [Verrucomicrobia bacterium]|jgi:hypothetical protein|nr:hypothetical protein [Verrucomicrobiota bacterium]